MTPHPRVAAAVLCLLTRRCREPLYAPNGDTVCRIPTLPIISESLRNLPKNAAAAP
ncbi:MAG: hypothetical protein LBS86_03130 [Treponema sp.]|nr:hypothetical protein [Treponema sp.]